MDYRSNDLLAALSGLDLSSADGRAGIATALAEIERREPGAILRAKSWADLQDVIQRNRS